MVTAAARAKYPKPICYSPLLKYVFIHIPKCAARIREMGSFSVFIRSEFGGSMLNEHHGRDLTEWISDGNEIIVDFVGRYENLDEDWSKVC